MLIGLISFFSFKIQTSLQLSRQRAVGIKEKWGWHQRSGTWIRFLLWYLEKHGSWRIASVSFGKGDHVRQVPQSIPASNPNLPSTVKCGGVCASFICICDSLSIAMEDITQASCHSDDQVRTKKKNDRNWKNRTLIWFFFFAKVNTSWSHLPLLCPWHQLPPFLEFQNDTKTKQVCEAQRKKVVSTLHWDRSSSWARSMCPKRLFAFATPTAMLTFHLSGWFQRPDLRSAQNRGHNNSLSCWASLAAWQQMKAIFVVVCVRGFVNLHLKSLRAVQITCWLGGIWVHAEDAIRQQCWFGTKTNHCKFSSWWWFQSCNVIFACPIVNILHWTAWSHWFTANCWNCFWGWQSGNKQKMISFSWSSHCFQQHIRQMGECCTWQNLWQLHVLGWLFPHWLTHQFWGVVCFSTLAKSVHWSVHDVTHKECKHHGLGLFLVSWDPNACFSTNKKHSKFHLHGDSKLIATWCAAPNLAFWHSLGLVGSIHALKLCCCHGGSLHNNPCKLDLLWTFQNGFKSWHTSSLVEEVKPNSEFGFLALSWVGWIHSCTEIVLLPLWIVAQQPRQIGWLLDCLATLQVLVPLQNCGRGEAPLQIWLCGPLLA